jgi:uncharacterized membrane protein
MKRITIRQVALIGILSAMVYVTSAFLQIPIPTAIGNTRLHMGNVMCLLSGLLLGPVYGGLAAGIGSMFFDLLNPAYIASAPFTFAFKFTMAWVCGQLAHRQPAKNGWLIAGAVLGAMTYVILYLSKSFLGDYLVLGMPFDAVWISVTQKAVVSITNGVIASAVSVPLYLALRPALTRADLLPH